MVGGCGDVVVDVGMWLWCGDGLDGWMDGWMDGWIGGWIGGWMDEGGGEGAEKVEEE